MIYRHLVATAIDEPYARKLLRKESFDLILSDVRLPQGKTNRIYWRMENGQKVYIDPNTKIYKKEEAHKFDIEEILKGIKK